YLFAIVGLWFNARSADRNGRYSVHVLSSLALGAVALVLSVAFGSVVALSVVLISIAMAGALAYAGPFWASAPAAVSLARAGAAGGERASTSDVIRRDVWLLGCVWRTFSRWLRMGRGSTDAMWRCDG